ncbi:uroporphyrinogen-III C-methyltransferase [Vibrio maerlii]|uniref:uroporphyrinogen-III C-methyltransferase n=1 Tax=Vibrio maerlii TaxID=2231648 RepID=UPI000E3C2C58|nr:uroporphyrinogen-III C-methyltransferase [Vibrio maerlii]
MTDKNKENPVPEEKTQKVEIEQPNSDSQEPKSEAEVESTKMEKQPKVEFEEKQGKRGVKLGTIAIIIALLMGGGATYQIQQQNQNYQAQIDALTQQLQANNSQMASKLDSVSKETISKAEQSTHKAETLIEQQEKSIQSLQLAISELKGRRPNDWLLAEADYLVKLAGRKLFLEKDVVSATLLMESADQRIATLNDPSLMPLRQTMADDITKLKSVDIIDKDGLVLRLIALQKQVDELPLANAILPDAPVEEKKEVSGDIVDWQDNLMTSLKDFSEHFITFRTRDGNVIPLLSPEQHFYLKENIKGKINTAIQAVYKEQGEIYQHSLDIAEEWTMSFFDSNDSKVVKFNQSLDALSKQNIAVEYPVSLATHKQLSDVISERLRRNVTSVIQEGDAK